MSTTEKATPSNEVSSLPRSATSALSASSHIPRLLSLSQVPCPTRRLPAPGAAVLLVVVEHGLDGLAVAQVRLPGEVARQVTRQARGDQGGLGQRLAEDLAVHPRRPLLEEGVADPERLGGRV